MSEDTKAALFLLTYISVAFVVFGFATASMGVHSPVSLLMGMVVAAFWPASGLIWLGVWLA